MKEIELGWRGEGAEIERQREIESVKERESKREQIMLWIRGNTGKAGRRGLPIKSLYIESIDRTGLRQGHLDLLQ